jgi:hypothetical protein
LISIGLLPLSFALTGPVSAAIGARDTMILAGLLGGVVTFAALFLPGMRAVEGRTKPAYEDEIDVSPRFRAPVLAAGPLEDTTPRFTRETANGAVSPRFTRDLSGPRSDQEREREWRFTRPGATHRSR